MDRSRRFDDGRRGGESYRPSDRRSPRSDLFPSRSPPRHRSPIRPTADTWTPSDKRAPARPRSRSPFRRRSPAPAFRSREATNTSEQRPRSPRRYSPRREFRQRSPIRVSRRSESPRRGSRSPPRGGRLRSPPYAKRNRDFSPNRGGRSPQRRERLNSPVRPRFGRYQSPQRGAFSPPRGPRSFRPRSRSPRVDIRRSSYLGPERRRSQSPDLRTARSEKSYGPGSSSNSRRSSPRPSHLDHQGPPITTAPERFSMVADNHQEDSRHGYSQTHSSHSPASVDDVKPLVNDRSRTPLRQTQRSASPPVKMESECTGVKQQATKEPTDQSEARQESHGHSHESNNPRLSRPPPTQPRNSSSLHNLPPTGPASSLPYHAQSRSHGHFPSAPTRPRGAFGRDFGPRRGGPPSYVGQGRGFTAEHSGPPTGPRNSFSSARPHESYQSAFRGNSNAAAASFTRPPRLSHHLASLPTVIPGGRLGSSGFDVASEKRITQLEKDREALFEQLEERSKIKRAGLHHWERLEKENTMSALKSDLAESHLHAMAGSDHLSSGAAF